MGCDGLELLTAYSEPDPAYRGLAEAVHLPYAPDWLAAWEGRPEDLYGDDALYFMYGRCREDVASNVARCIEAAASLSPAHGVFHACNADTAEIFRRRYTRDDSHVLAALCELMNEVVGAMPGGEPPFRILFENLWWPGLRLTDESGYRFLERGLEFDDWGICLDTGHLMSCLPVTSESEGIDMLEGVFSGYSRGLVDRIGAVHLHWSASAEYRRTFEEGGAEGTMSERLVRANEHVGKIDMHMPFTDPRCAGLVEMLSPRFVVHEMLGSEDRMMAGFRTQRSHFPDAPRRRPSGRLATPWVGRRAF